MKQEKGNRWNITQSDNIVDTELNGRFRSLCVRVFFSVFCCCCFTLILLLAFFSFRFYFCFIEIHSSPTKWPDKRVYANHFKLVNGYDSGIPVFDSIECVYSECFVDQLLCVCVRKRLNLYFFLSKILYCVVVLLLQLTWLYGFTNINFLLLVTFIYTTIDNSQVPALY